jgi:hypothetical protein
MSIIEVAIVNVPRELDEKENWMDGKEIALMQSCDALKFICPQRESQGS